VFQEKKDDLGLENHTHLQYQKNRNGITYLCHLWRYGQTSR
jgi:hypothetical protein